jgi:Pyruvate/2-oxoacid:ferredoxin oxidoreductase delta subunit
MNKPCIVCQENCPVSPKAIYVREEFQVIRDGTRKITSVAAGSLTLDGAALPPGTLGTGDFFVRLDNAAAGERRLIAENSSQSLKLAALWPEAPAVGGRIFIEVRLQKPCVDPARCIGCGICEHECPVSGLRAIRVSAENESRNNRHSLMAGA